MNTPYTPLLARDAFAHLSPATLAESNVVLSSPDTTVAQPTRWWHVRRRVMNWLLSTPAADAVMVPVMLRLNRWQQWCRRRVTARAAAVHQARLSAADDLSSASASDDEGRADTRNEHPVQPGEIRRAVARHRDRAYVGLAADGTVNPLPSTRCIPVAAWTGPARWPVSRVRRLGYLLAVVTPDAPRVTWESLGMLPPSSPVHVVYAVQWGVDVRIRHMVVPPSALGIGNPLLKTRTIFQRTVEAAHWHPDVTEASEAADFPGVSAVPVDVTDAVATMMGPYGNFDAHVHSPVPLDAWRRVLQWGVKSQVPVLDVTQGTLHITTTLGSTHRFQAQDLVKF